MASVRCRGMTRSGQRCSIVSLSNMRDYSGRLVADPLRKGAEFCMMHTVLFMVQPTHPDESIIAYIDLETNSLDVLSGNIVEIGALIGGTRGMFSTVVHPGHDKKSEDASVHGIPRAELLLGPHFAEVFFLFVGFNVC